MKRFFEHDIPVLQGKTRQERNVLLRQAHAQDWRIMGRTLLLSILAPCGVTILMELHHDHLLPPPIWRDLLIYLFMIFPLHLLVYRLWIEPLIKAALRNPKPNHALQPTAGAGDVPAKYDY